MPLLDLPSEILISIYEHLGPTELRRDVEYLLVCKRLYKAAHIMYLRDLQLSKLRLSSYDLERLPPKGSLLFRLIQHKANHLSVTLVGHPSRKVSLTSWDEGPVSQFAEDQEVDIDERVIVDGKVIRIWEGDWQPALQNWKSLINQKLGYLAENLPLFRNLQSFSFEASCESDADEGPRWDYLFAATVFHLIQELPTGLLSLNLDICGTELLDSGGNGFHICPLLGQRLKRFRSARLRMRSICPMLFQACDAIDSLDTLIIRLNLPMYSDYHGGNEYYDAKLCRQYGQIVAQQDLARRMASRGIAYGRQLAHETFRIGCRFPISSVISLCVIDCLSEEVLSNPSGVLCYEEDARSWCWNEESQSLRQGSRFNW